MEQKSNKGLKVTIVILVLIVLGLGGYIAYDKLYAKEDKKVENKKQDNEMVEDEGTNRNDAYQEFLNNMSENIAYKEVNLLDLTQEEYDNNNTKSIVFEKGYLYYENDNKKEKFNTNKIIDMYFIDIISQSDSDFIFILDENGDIYYIVSSFDWEEDVASIKPVKIKELKEIIAFDAYRKEAYGTADFIDINGNRYDAIEILEKYNLEGDAY